MENENFIGGCYYELPNKKVVRVYGFMDHGNKVMFNELNGNANTEDTKTAKSTWILRKDLDDFPGQTDPKLPYVFDLLYDMKRKSELDHELERLRGLEKLVKEHNLF